jgi:hypothetical protein
LVAAFNRRYHRSRLALAAALTSLGCEVRRCEERLTGLNAIVRRPLSARLAALLERGPADLVLVFKGLGLDPAGMSELRRRTRSLDRDRSVGARAHYLAFGCDPAYLGPESGSARWRAALSFVGSRDPQRERVLREHTWAHRLQEPLTVTLR